LSPLIAALPRRYLLLKISERLAIARILTLFILVLLFAQPFSSGMDTFSTPWIANLTQESVEISFVDSRNIEGNFQLNPGRLLQYTVGPQQIVTLNVARASGKVQSYDQTTLQRLRARAGVTRDYLLILPDALEFVSKDEFKSRLAAFKRQR
jgi:hypothetical protein